MSYIDREKLIAEYDRVHKGPPGGARKLMSNAPAEDVVKVVRCKDCKYYRSIMPGRLGERDYEYTDACTYATTLVMKVQPDHYCSFRVRKH